MKLKKLISLAASAMLIFTMAGCKSDSTTFKAGTYEGTAKGFAGEIKLEVILSDEAITEVNILENSETDGIGSKALETLPSEIVATQSVDVDVVAGATVSSNAIIEAVTAALKTAGVDASKLVKKEVQETAKTVETKEVDVVIVGAGGAGMAAAIEAANAGKTVLVVEKASMTGGNTTRATGGMNAAATPEQALLAEFKENAGVEKTIATAKEKFPELAELVATVEQQYAEFQAGTRGTYFDSVELFELDTLVGGQNKNNIELVNVLAEQSAAGIAWLQTIDANLSEVGSFGGASVKRIHKPVNAEGKTVAVGSYLVPIMEDTLKELNVEILFDTPASEIIMSDGVATGVKASSKTVDYTINAKAVIIATGGFAGNSEMVEGYQASLKGFVSTNAPTITGDGIKMGEAVGAATVDMDQIQIHPTVEQATSALITEGLRGDGAILVNQEGKRFFDEVGTRDAVSKAEIAQTGGYAYLIVDQAMVDKSSVIAGYITKGYTVQGETYEELAKAMGSDEATFKATMETWNAAVTAGVDAEFNRTSFANPLDTAPYYAIKVSPGVHHTMGGLMINTNTEVLTTDGAVIKGLYAAGEVTGGVHGANRLGGNAVADIIVFGRIAGQNAAASIQ